MYIYSHWYIIVATRYYIVVIIYRNCKYMSIYTNCLAWYSNHSLTPYLLFLSYLTLSLHSQPQAKWLILQFPNMARLCIFQHAPLLGHHSKLHSVVAFLDTLTLARLKGPAQCSLLYWADSITAFLQHSYILQSPVNHFWGSGRQASLECPSNAWQQ